MDPRQIPDWATVRYAFSSPGELVFAAHYVPLVRTLDGRTVEGISFTRQEAADQFDRLVALHQGSGQSGRRRS